MDSPYFFLHFASLVLTPALLIPKKRKIGSELYLTILRRECYRTLRYVYYVYKKIVIERTRDLIYLKFVATDSLRINTSLRARPFTKQLRWKLNFSTSLLQRFTAESSQELRRNEEISRGKCRCSLSSSSNC